MEEKDIQAVYFIGAGGIGMSAIARYYISRGMVAAGYDKTPSDLTAQLEKEGMLIHYDEDVEKIPYACKDSKSCLVIYTPAVPADHKELVYFRENGFHVEKRAQALGRLTMSNKGLCVAGTHGKTTTSAMCAHILHQSHIDCNAFLGGISKNYGTNYILAKESPYVVIEADEFDRSFHWLRPYMSVITSADADHLDIYGTREAYLESFRHYTTLVKPGGALIVHKDIGVKIDASEDVRVYEYSREEGDFHAENIKIDNGTISFDFISPVENVEQIELGQPVAINIDNSIAAMAMAQLCGCNANELRYGIKTFSGVERRFDIKINDSRHVLLSDYAHHPAEICQSIKSVRQMFPGRRITVIFQPHLYSRTRDFYMEFAEALSLSDEVVVCEIYPAREQPIEGVTSRLIYDDIKPGVEKSMIRSDEVPEMAGMRDFDVLMVLGAGNLDNYVPRIETIIRNK